ncbi:MAG: MBL fold metallo-hydrolase, partial [bacterium]|jgi:rhodanese-related sulfurtransferase|nr:MBL fold metallo-hydrolase [bacterium]
VWVHCRSGYRASIAAAILARAGRSVVAIDEELAGAGAAGFDIGSSQEVAA